MPSLSEILFGKSLQPGQQAMDPNAPKTGIPTQIGDPWSWHAEEEAAPPIDPNVSSAQSPAENPTSVREVTFGPEGSPSFTGWAGGAFQQPAGQQGQGQGGGDDSSMWWDKQAPWWDQGLTFVGERRRFAPAAAMPSININMQQSQWQQQAQWMEAGECPEHPDTPAHEHPPPPPPGRDDPPPPVDIPPPVVDIPPPTHIPNDTPPPVDIPPPPPVVEQPPPPPPPVVQQPPPPPPFIPDQPFVPAVIPPEWSTTPVTWPGGSPVTTPGSGRPWNTPRPQTFQRQPGAAPATPPAVPSMPGSMPGAGASPLTPGTIPPITPGGIVPPQWSTTPVTWPSGSPFSPGRPGWNAPTPGILQRRPAAPAQPAPGAAPATPGAAPAMPGAAPPSMGMGAAPATPPAPPSSDYPPPVPARAPGEGRDQPWKGDPAYVNPDGTLTPLGQYVVDQQDFDTLRRSGKSIYWNADGTPTDFTKQRAADPKYGPQWVEDHINAELQWNKDRRPIKVNPDGSFGGFADSNYGPEPAAAGAPAAPPGAPGSPDWNLFLGSGGSQYYNSDGTLTPFGQERLAVGALENDVNNIRAGLGLPPVKLDAQGNIIASAASAAPMDGGLNGWDKAGSRFFNDDGSLTDYGKQYLALGGLEAFRAEVNKRRAAAGLPPLQVNDDGTSPAYAAETSTERIDPNNPRVAGVPGALTIDRGPEMQPAWTPYTPAGSSRNPFGNFSGASGWQPNITMGSPTGAQRPSMNQPLGGNPLAAANAPRGGQRITGPGIGGGRPSGSGNTPMPAAWANPWQAPRPAPGSSPRAPAWPTQSPRPTTPPIATRPPPANTPAPRPPPTSTRPPSSPRPTPMSSPPNRDVLRPPTSGLGSSFRPPAVRPTAPSLSSSYRPPTVRPSTSAWSTTPAWSSPSYRPPPTRTLQPGLSSSFRPPAVRPYQSATPDRPPTPAPRPSSAQTRVINTPKSGSAIGSLKAFM